MSEPKCIPDIVLEQYLLGELNPERAREIDLRLAEDRELQRRVEALRASNEQILSAMPPHRAVADIGRKLRREQEPAAREARTSWFLLPAVATAAVALIAVLVFVSAPSGNDSANNHDVTGILTKGDAAITLYRKAGNGTEILTDGSRARRGDTLQIGYTAAGMRYGVIASLDGRGSVTLHLPQRPGPASELQPGAVLLPVSYELDDAPGFERFFFVASMQPFAAGDVTTALEDLYKTGEARTRAPVFPEKYMWYSVVVVK